MLGLPHFNEPPILDGIRARTSRLFARDKKVQVAMGQNGFLFVPAHVNSAPYAAGIVENDLSEGGGAGSGRTCCCGCDCPDCYVNSPKFGVGSGILSASGISVPSCFSGMCSFPSCSGASYQYTSTINPNGSWSLDSGTLSFDSSLFPCCTWSKQDSTVGSLWAGCPSTGRLVGNTIAWALTKKSGYWKLICMGPEDFSQFPTAFFIGTIATSPLVNCSNTLTFSNDFTSTSCYFDPQFGNCWLAGATGGTVVVSFP